MPSLIAHSQWKIINMLCAEPVTATSGTLARSGAISYQRCSHHPCIWSINVWPYKCFLYGFPKYILYKFLKIQTNGGKIIFRTKKRECITPVLKNLHRLLIDFRIQFELLLTTFKVLKGLAPGYVCDMLHPFQPPSALQSMNLALHKRLSAKIKTGGASHLQ